MCRRGAKESKPIAGDDRKQKSQPSSGSVTAWRRRTAPPVLDPPVGHLVAQPRRAGFAHGPPPGGCLPGLARPVRQRRAGVGSGPEETRPATVNFLQNRGRAPARLNQFRVCFNPAPPASFQPTRLIEVGLVTQATAFVFVATPACLRFAALASRALASRARTSSRSPSLALPTSRASASRARIPLVVSR